MSARGARRSLLAGLLLALLAVPASALAEGQCGDASGRPWCNTSLTPDARAKLLLDALSPQQRIDLLGGDNVTGVLSLSSDSHTGTDDGISSVGVPTVNYTDGPLGPRQGAVTGMPSPMADAATWRPVDNHVYGQVVGNEARDKGNDVVFGPTVNLMRTPLGGRTYEAFGEDPFLVSQTAVSWIDGVQSTGEMADVKHFAENNQEGASACCSNTIKPGDQLVAAQAPSDIQGGRMNVNVHVDERTLREMELAPFEAAVKQAHVATIMCSYNLVGGAHSCENNHLLVQVLGQWGFQGYVLADYGAAHDTGPSLKSGLDFEPWPGFDVYGQVPVTQALLQGQATQGDVDRHVLRMLRTEFAYGLFDRGAYTDNPATINQGADARVSERVESDAITLLRNQHNILPLNASRLSSIAVIGAGGSTYITGGGSGNVTPFKYDTPASAIAARMAGKHVLTDDGSDASRAAAVAKQAQVAVVLVPDYASEGVDRACLTFECPDAFGDEDGLIKAVTAANPHTVVVLETAGPILTPWRGQVAGLLEAWYPGQEAGPALAQVLFGDRDPSGHLPVTFPDSMSQEPTAGSALKYPGVGNQEVYGEGVFGGYRWFAAHHETPAYPFGFGLSYTSWKLSKWKLNGRKLTVLVKNTGKRAGSTVVQVYLGLPSSRAVPQPPRVLRDYRAVTLGRGRSAAVHFSLTLRDLAYWSLAASGWKIGAGLYRVFGGLSSTSAPQVATFRERKTVGTQ